jgi:hypothetical protein
MPLEKSVPLWHREQTRPGATFLRTLSERLQLVEKQT